MFLTKTGAVKRKVAGLIWDLPEFPPTYYTTGMASYILSEHGPWWSCVGFLRACEKTQSKQGKSLVTSVAL